MKKKFSLNVRHWVWHQVLLNFQLFMGYLDTFIPFFRVEELKSLGICFLSNHLFQWELGHLADLVQGEIYSQVFHVISHSQPPVTTNRIIILGLEKSKEKRSFFLMQNFMQNLMHNILLTKYKSTHRNQCMEFNAWNKMQRIQRTL